MNLNFTKMFAPLVPIKFIIDKFNPVLLYHSLGNTAKFNNNVDHVNLEILNSQLTEIQKYWTFVSIDEYAKAKNKKGLASITIDDGYKNVINESLQVFRNLNIPITIFINCSTLEGKIFWRDKIRYLIENKLVRQYINTSTLFSQKHIDNFYKISKNPKFNSIIVEKEINKFLLKENLNLNGVYNLCFDSNKYLIKDNLVSYGNHTSNHYLLSSLKKQEQYEEIFKCKDYLNKQNVNKSEVFSIPFGGMNSYNKDTLTNLEDLNYKIILNSSNNLDKNKISNEINRFMPKTYNIENTLKKLYLKKITKL